MASLAVGHHTASPGSHREDNHAAGLEAGHQDRNDYLEDNSRTEDFLVGRGVADLADHIVGIGGDVAVADCQELLSALVVVEAVWRSIHSCQ